MRSSPSDATSTWSPSSWTSAAAARQRNALVAKETKERLANAKKYRSGSDEAMRRKKLAIIVGVLVVLILVVLYMQGVIGGGE